MSRSLDRPVRLVRRAPPLTRTSVNVLALIGPDPDPQGRDGLRVGGRKVLRYNTGPAGLDPMGRT